MRLKGYTESTEPEVQNLSWILNPLVSDMALSLGRQVR